MTGMPLSNDETEGAVAYVARHYVTMSYYAPDAPRQANGLAQCGMCSGFIMEARGRWFFVTAGHVLRDLDDSQRNTRLTSFRFWDWSPCRKYSGYVPISFEAMRKSYIDQDGLDWGLLEIGPLIRANLEANGVAAVGESHYGAQWPTEFDECILIGTPGTTVSLEPVSGTTTNLKQSAVAIQLEQIGDLALVPEAMRDYPDRFFARIMADEASDLWKRINGDIRGMSGGPVIGIRKEADGLRYWVVGIQSTIFSERRIIAASFFQVFALLVCEWLDRTNGDLC